MKRPKAYLMILILLSSLFTVTLINPKPVSAVTPSTPFCCEKTLSGEFCKYTPSSNCDNNFQRAPASCSYTDFCKTGCCVLDGACSGNLPKSACENNNGVWSSTSCNDLEQCGTGCCIIGASHIFATESKCQKLHEPFPDLEFQFRRDITSESACLNLALAREEGCCKVDENTYTFGTRSECSQITGNIDVSNPSFYPRTYCSQITTNCQPAAKKACLPGTDDVYWFDSCGNQEGIAQECDYDAGTICGEKNNEFTCISTDCDDSVYGNKRNGESWCEYDNEEILDAVGSGHYRRACINGELIYEECAGFRQEVCLQSTAVDGKTEAKCVPNTVSCPPINNKEACESELTCQWMEDKCVSLFPPGGRFWQGISTCSTADDREEFEEDDGSTQQQWTDAKYLECTAIGDCGNKDNWVGIYSEGGYLNDCKTESQEVIDQGRARTQQNMQAAGGLASAFGGIAGLGLLGATTVTTFTATAVTAAGTTVTATGASAAAATEAVVAQGGISALTTTSATSLTTLGYLAAAFTVIAVVAVIVSLISISSDEDTVSCTATCSSWAPSPAGDCSKCTEDPNKPCTEYKCRSLGAACRIINENTPFVECTASAIDDGLSPKITPLNNILTEGFSLSETTNGYKINEGLPIYKALSFGIITDEPAACKMSIKTGIPYKDMEAYFGTNLYLREHNLTLTIPREFLDPRVLEQTQSKFNLYAKCQDTFGNANELDYYIEIPVLPGPDLTAPIIELTSIKNNAQLPTQITETDFSVFLNEPSECRYSTTIDTIYEQMPFSFACADSFNDISLIGYGLYECKTKLTQINHNEDNNYWIRCRDQPKELDLTKRNTNSESYIFTIEPTEPLVIEEKGPEGEIFTNNPTLFVRTSGGSNDGLAECGFTEKITLPYIKFFKTGFALHEQNLNALEKRRYGYHIQCIDSVGNIAKDKIEFNVASDIHIPIIQSIVTNADSLTLTLNEKATCQYSNSGFSFGSGTLTEINSTIHNLPNQDVLYVICRDTSGNDAPFTLYT